MRWVRLCNLDDVSTGAMTSLSVENVEVVVVRGESGYLVIPPSCPHMATPLCDGFFDGSVLTCSKHLWQWSIPDGTPIGEAKAPLLTYESQTRDGEIWVNLAQELVYQHQEDD